jgi:hypothetical protein
LLPPSTTINSWGREESGARVPPNERSSLRVGMIMDSFMAKVYVNASEMLGY